jgi:hypothetical protein
MNAEGTFLPDSFTWTYSHPEKTKMFSGGLSSIQLLPNNNTLIEVGNLGYAFEITSDNEIIWEYKVPLRMGNPVAQGETLVSNDNVTWRMHRYPTDYPAFEGRDLSPKGFIELNPDTAFCEIISAIDDVSKNQFILYPNPASSSCNVIRHTYETVQLHVTDVYGRTVLTMQLNDAIEEIQIDELPSGLYWVQIADHTVQALRITH